MSKLRLQPESSSFPRGKPHTRRKAPPSSQPPDRPQEGSPPSLRQGSTVSHQTHPSSLPPQTRVGCAGPPPLLSSPRSEESPCPSWPLKLLPQHLTVASSCDQEQLTFRHRCMSPARALLLATASPLLLATASPLLLATASPAAGHCLPSTSLASTNWPSCHLQIGISSSPTPTPRL